MKKMLVTTDLSNASKAGVRFAIQLSTQTDVELVFFHCFQALIPTTVNPERIKRELQRQGNLQMKKLELFIARIHKAMKAPGRAYRCVVVESLDTERAILDYAEEHAFHYICMSTRGAGILRKLLGTHTAYVLHRSPIPVLVVPQTYRLKPIKKLLYASDLEHLQEEMTLVGAFAKDLKIKTDLAHFHFPGDLSLDPKTVSEMWAKQYKQLDQVYLKPYNLDLDFPAQLAQLTAKTKPSIVVFFTHNNRKWLDKWFGTSISEAASFVTKVPMLVFRKK